MWTIIAQQAVNDGITPYINLGATGAVCSLLIWLITKAFPAMFERHDQIQQNTISRFETVTKETRDHFEDILTKIDNTRSVAAKEGHDAAKQLSTAIAASTECTKDNTRAVEGLARRIVSVTVTSEK